MMDWYFGILKKYAEFSGRTGRAEFWKWTLYHVAAFEIVETLVVQFRPPLVGLPLYYGGKVYAGAVFLPSVAVATRRLHDRDKSAWWLLLGLLPPFGWIALCVLACSRGTAGPNKYGQP
jgi:uncharacterized membrane protein YhaH (DUF805 family)